MYLPKKGKSMPKRILPLSESQVENAKAKNKDYKLSDGFGLHLLVKSTSGKLWRFQYRYSGQQKVLALGSYPRISLVEAREKTEEAKKQLADGLDPSQLKKEQKISQLRQEECNFEMVAREWHEQFRSQLSKPDADHLLARLQYDVFPFIGNNPISKIKPSDLLIVLRRIELRALTAARRIKTAFGHIFRYAVVTGRAEHNPLESLRGALTSHNHKHFSPSMESKSIAFLLLAIDGYEGSFVVKCAMKLAIFLLVEQEELCHAEWVEIDFLREQWNIPAQKMKMAQVHIVPLARQVIETLRQLGSLTGNGKYVFPSLRSPIRCMSHNAINAGLRAIGFGKDVIAAKGLWEVARNVLTEEPMVKLDIVECQLSRGIENSNGTDCNPMQFLPQRREMMQKWADYLDGLGK